MRSCPRWLAIALIDQPFVRSACASTQFSHVNIGTGPFDGQQLWTSRTLEGAPPPLPELRRCVAEPGEVDLAGLGRFPIIRRGKSYSVVVDLGRDPETGKRRQKWHSGYRTKREAEAALADLVGSVNRGTYVAPSKQSFAEFAADWLEAIKPTLRDSTHYSYTRNLRLHVIPHLGALNMTAVDAGVLNGLYARLLASGNKTNRPGAAPDCRPAPCATSTRSCTACSKTRCAGAASSATRPTQPTLPGPRPRGARRS